MKTKKSASKKTDGKVEKSRGYNIDLFILNDTNVDQWLKLLDEEEPRLIRHLGKAKEYLETAKDAVKYHKGQLSMEWQEKKEKGLKITDKMVGAHIDTDEIMVKLRADRARWEGRVVEMEAVMWAVRRRAERANTLKDHMLRLERRETE